MEDSVIQYLEVDRKESKMQQIFSAVDCWGLTYLILQ